jgi:hypothetical protein
MQRDANGAVYDPSCQPGSATSAASGGRCRSRPPRSTGASEAGESFFTRRAVISPIGRSTTVRRRGPTSWYGYTRGPGGPTTRAYPRPTSCGSDGSGARTTATLRSPCRRISAASSYGESAINRASFVSRSTATHFPALPARTDESATGSGLSGTSLCGSIATIVARFDLRRSGSRYALVFRDDSGTIDGAGRWLTLNVRTKSTAGGPGLAPLAGTDGSPLTGERKNLADANHSLG